MDNQQLTKIGDALAASGWRFIERAVDRVIAMDADGRCVDYRQTGPSTYSVIRSNPPGRWRWLRCALYNAVR